MTGVCLAVAVLATASFQDETQVLELPCEWRAGDRYRIELVKERRRSKDGVEQPSVKVLFSIDVEVLKRNEEGFVFRWTYGPAKLVGAATPEGAGAEAMLGWVRGMRLEFQTDGSGTPTQLTNREEVRAFYEKGMELVWKFVEQTGKRDSSEIEKAKKLWKSIMDSQFGELAGLREPTLFYMVTGASLQVGKAKAYDDELPNPLGGEPFPSKASVLLKKVDREKGEAQIEWNLTLDPEKTPQILLKTIKEKAKELGGKPLEEDKLPRMEIEDRADIVMDLKTGWPRSLFYERSAEAGPGRQIDRMEFKVQAPKKD